jgi:hypothetical protein
MDNMLESDFVDPDIREELITGDDVVAECSLFVGLKGL